MDPYIYKKLRQKYCLDLYKLLYNNINQINDLYILLINSVDFKIEAINFLIRKKHKVLRTKLIQKFYKFELLNLNDYIPIINIKVNTCSICLDDVLNSGKKVKCGHLFHKKCIDEWIKQSNECPNCRLKIDNKIIQLSYRSLNHFRESLESSWGSNTVQAIGRVFRSENSNLRQTNNPETHQINNPNNLIPNEDDIILVIDQARCTREEAISALINQNLDLVNAIMELTI